MIDGDGVQLAYTAWGDPQKPTIVLVHGYPDNSEVWHPLVEYLAKDFHLVAYDVRGAGQSSRPTGRDAYRLSHLMNDFIAVIDRFSPHRPVHVVAHDWGSVQSWESVTEPALRGRIASFTSCSGPCLDHMGWWMKARMQRPSARRVLQLFRQSLKSWYVYFFHLPVLPEALWRTVFHRTWPAAMRWIEGVKVEPRATQAADGAHGLWLYRANVFPRLLAPRERRAQVPVQLLVPLHDHFISPDLYEDLDQWVDVLWRREFEAGHWMPLTHARDMAGAIRRFVRFTERPVSSLKVR